MTARRRSAMHFEDDGITFGPAAADPAVELLADLARIAAHAAEPRAAALACLERLVAHAGAFGGFVSVSSGQGPEGRLEVIAMLGPHASLIGEASFMDFDHDSDIAAAFRSGEPHFEGTVYDDGDEAEGHPTSRWREMISMQASAALPLATDGRPFGVMMLEWSARQQFDDEVRAVLETAALLTAIAIERADGRGFVASPGDADPLAASQETPHVVARQPLDAGPVPLDEGIVPCIPQTAAAELPLAFEITPEGMVVPHREGEDWVDGAVRVTLPAVRAEDALLDVHAVSGGRVLMLVGAVSGLGGRPRDEMIDTLRHTARVIAARENADVVLSSCLERLRDRAGVGATLDAWMGVWDASTCALTHAQIGRAGARIIMCDGRDRYGEPDVLSTWLPLAEDILHAWVPAVSSLRAEWLTR